jgi:hypothetical protein
MTVFVIQQQMKYDQATKELVPRFSSIDKAESWGKMVYLLSPSAHPFDPPLVLGDMHEKLKDFSDDDHLLLIGNPALIGMATAIAAHYNNGSVKLLQWSGRNDRYIEVVTKIY